MPIPKKKPVTKKVAEEVLDLENDEILEEEEILEEDDIVENVEEEIEEEAVEEEEEEIPAPKKVVKKTAAKKTAPAKKATAKVAKKTAPAKKATKPTKKVEEKAVKEERKLTKDDIIKAKKIINANAIESFNEAVDEGRFAVDFGDKTSATRNDFAKIFVNNVAEVLNGEDEGKAKHIAQVLNLSNVTIANCETLIGVFEKTFMDLVEKQMTFVFGYNPSTGGITSIKRRTIMGRAFNSLDKAPSYTPFYATMKLEYPVGKEVIKGEYDADKNVFTDENGKKHDIDKENSAAIAKDKKEFARNYPSHLTKK